MPFASAPEKEATLRFIMQNRKDNRRVLVKKNRYNNIRYQNMMDKYIKHSMMRFGMIAATIMAFSSQQALMHKIL